MAESTVAKEGDTLRIINKPVNTGVVETGMKLGQKVAIENRLRWVKLPRGCSTDSVKWWPAVQYESYSELIQDIGECSIIELRILNHSH